MHGVNIVYRLGIRVIAKLNVIATHTKDVLDAGRSHREKVGLESDSVPVAACQVHYRFRILLKHHTTYGPWTHAHGGPVVVRDSESVNHTFEFLYELPQAFKIGPLRGINTCGR
jgi:hypothetical protein